jgi:hypothetical protein
LIGFRLKQKQGVSNSPLFYWQAVTGQIILKEIEISLSQAVTGEKLLSKNILSKFN